MLAEVMSSWVGPMPPVVKTWSCLRAQRVDRLDDVGLGVGHHAHLAQLDADLVQLGRQEGQLASCVRPERISLPMMISAAVTVRSLMSVLPCCCGRYNAVGPTCP